MGRNEVVQLIRCPVCDAHHLGPGSVCDNCFLGIWNGQVRHDHLTFARERFLQITTEAEHSQLSEDPIVLQAMMLAEWNMDSLNVIMALAQIRRAEKRIRLVQFNRELRIRVRRLPVHCGRERLLESCVDVTNPEKPMWEVIQTMIDLKKKVERAEENARKHEANTVRQRFLGKKLHPAFHGNRTISDKMRAKNAEIARKAIETAVANIA